jgi:hypothetical protein
MRLSSFLYRASRAVRTAEAVERSIQTGSPEPLMKRIANIFIGRAIVSKMWWK